MARWQWSAPERAAGASAMWGGRRSSGAVLAGAGRRGREREAARARQRRWQRRVTMGGRRREAARGREAGEPRSRAGGGDRPGQEGRGWARWDWRRGADGVTGGGTRLVAAMRPAGVGHVRRGAEGKFRVRDGGDPEFRGGGLFIEVEGARKLQMRCGLRPRDRDRTTEMMERS